MQRSFWFGGHTFWSELVGAWVLLLSCVCGAFVSLEVGVVPLLLLTGGYSICSLTILQLGDSTSYLGDYLLVYILGYFSSS